jgi:hypothetical protein
MDIQNNIEQYLQGQMTDAEKSDFEKDLADNDLLREQLELQQEIINQIKSRAFVNAQLALARVEVENDSNELEKEIATQISSRAFVDKQIDIARRANKKIKLRVIYFRATSFAASILIIFSLFIELKKPSKKEFLSHYSYDLIIDGYESNMNKNDERGLSNTEETALRLAEKNYINKNFEATINILDKINSLETKNPKLYFLFALSNLNQGNYQIAIESLNKLLKNKNIEFYDEALYFSAIAYYMNYNSTKARKQIKKLKSKKSPILNGKENILSDMKLF